MGRIIDNLNKGNNKFLNSNFNKIEGLKEVDFSIAGYLARLEIIRCNLIKNGSATKDFVYCSAKTIMNNTNIKSNLTVIKSLERLKEKGIIEIRKTKSGGYIVNKEYYPNHDYINFNADTKGTKEIESPELSINNNDEIKDLLRQLLKEIKELKSQNNELKREIESLKSSNNRLEIIEEPVIKIEKVEKPIETRSQKIEQPSSNLSERMKKVMNLYKDIDLKPFKEEPVVTEEPVIEKKNIQPLLEEPDEPVIEKRNYQPVFKYPKSKKEYTDKQLNWSLIFNGLSIYGLQNNQLKEELNYRLYYNIDSSLIYNEIERRNKVYIENPNINNNGFYEIFINELKSA